MTRDRILNMPAGIMMDFAIATKVMHSKIIHPYSTEMTSTLMVIDKMEPKDFSTYTYDNGYGARINSDFIVKAATLQLAICRAALLAVMDLQ